MIALISNEQLENMNQVMVKQLKNRYNDITSLKRFTLGIDRSKMRLYDIDDPTDGLVPTTDSQQENTFVNRGRSTEGFSDFKT
jgi:hypothetical protein